MRTALRLEVGRLLVSLAVSVREMPVDAPDFILLSYAMVVNKCIVYKSMCMGRLWKFATEARKKDTFRHESDKFCCKCWWLSYSYIGETAA